MPIKLPTARREEQERIAVEKYFESKVSKEFLSKKILDIEKSRVWEDIDYNSYRLVYERSSFKACTHPKKYPRVRVYKKYWRVGDEKLDALSDGFQHLRRDKEVFVTDIPRKALLLGEEVDVVEVMYERREKDWFGKTRYRQDRVRILLDNLCIREIPESYQ